MPLKPYKLKTFVKRLGKIRIRRAHNKKELDQIEELSEEQVESAESKPSEPAEEESEESDSEGGESEIEELSEEAPHASMMFGPVIDYERHGEEVKVMATNSKQPVKR
jgi:hypothetical protein